MGFKDGKKGAKIHREYYGISKRIYSESGETENFNASMAVIKSNNDFLMKGYKKIDHSKIDPMPAQFTGSEKANNNPVKPWKSSARRDKAL